MKLLLKKNASITWLTADAPVTCCQLRGWVGLSETLRTEITPLCLSELRGANLSHPTRARDSRGVNRPRSPSCSDFCGQLEIIPKTNGTFCVCGFLSPPHTPPPPTPNFQVEKIFSCSEAQLPHARPLASGGTIIFAG